MSYLKRNEENEAAVLLALELAYDRVGGPVTVDDVQRVGFQFQYRDESWGERASRYSIFSLRNRTRKYLRKLVRQGLVIEEAYARGHRFRYAPASETSIEGAEMLRKLLSTQEPEVLVVGPLVDGTTAAREFDRFLDSEMENLLDVGDLGEEEEELLYRAELDCLGRVIRVEDLAREVKDIEGREGVGAARQFIEETVLSRDEE